MFCFTDRTLPGRIDLTSHHPISSIEPPWKQTLTETLPSWKEKKHPAKVIVAFTNQLKTLAEQKEH